VTVIAAGRAHTCAVVAGALECWGYNGPGALGDGTWANRPTPVTVFADGTTTVGTGPYQTCAWASGLLRCWGDNSYGQSGTGTTGGLIASPTLVRFP
jgi:alpha-tubulin suppressor-like RCC1 family protein